MNPVIRFLLKIISLPIFDITRDYKIIRRFQEFASLKTEKPDGFRLFDEQITFAGGSYRIPVRVFEPPIVQKKGAILFFHGGGYTTGNVDFYTPTCIQLAKRTGMNVLSVDYRLAPEHPYPAGLNDCQGALYFFSEEHHERFTPLIVMGDSAGGNLAAASCFRMKKNGDRLPKGMALIYPAVGWDYSDTSPFASVHEKAENYGLTQKKLQEYYSLYVPNGALKNPEIAPILEDDFSDMPQTFIATAEHDPLRDEGETFGHRLQEASIPTEIHRMKNVPHGFWTSEKVFEDSIEKLYELLLPWLEKIHEN